MANIIKYNNRIVGASTPKTLVALDTDTPAVPATCTERNTQDEYLILLQDIKVILELILIINIICLIRK